MLIWIRALFSAAAEIKTLEGREMLIGLIRSPGLFTAFNTFSLTSQDGITIVGQGYDLLGLVQFWSAWSEFIIGYFLVLEFWVWTMPQLVLISCICQSCLESMIDD